MKGNKIIKKNKKKENIVTRSVGFTVVGPTKTLIGMSESSLNEPGVSVDYVHHVTSTCE